MQKSKNRYLTKSRFKLAVECPTKLYYSGKPEYRDALEENDFLKALAEGGYQVGALAQLRYPDGIEVKAASPEQAEADTAKYLEQENVVLFEPAIRVGNFLIRIDILVKTGNQFELIEVKAKSYDSLNPEIEGKQKEINASMRPYIQDAAFQTWVLRQAYPQASISTFLMMPDKSKVATQDGINQMFKITPESSGFKVDKHVPGNIDAMALAKELLAKVPVDMFVSKVLNEPIKYPGGEGFLADLAAEWSAAYKHDEKISPAIGAQCGNCQFVSKDGDPRKSGFLECWTQATGLDESVLSSGTVLDLWNFRGKQKLITQRQYRLTDVCQDDLGDFDPESNQDGLCRQQRQWLQVKDAISRDSAPTMYFDRLYVTAAMNEWKHPLHFIDFETSSVALPFYKGMHPYEPVAFQFSHHTMLEDGTVSHVGEFLGVEPGIFPNFEFARALKGELENDDGTVFMWSHHENTILTKIAAQLEDFADAGSDQEDLIAFLKTLTKGGNREMVDLCKISEKAFFHPDTKGSNSIKKVLPAILKVSEKLKMTYSKPIYGAPGGIKSKNFAGEQGVAWMESEGSDPYSKLKSIAKEMLPAGAPEDSVIAEGGAAATAYARLQFETLNAVERQRIENALLRYCELDTLAMVMVVQGWKGLCYGAE